MADETLDVKTEALDSSPKADAIDGSSPSGTPAAADANANQSMADFISKGMPKTDEAKESSPEADGEKGLDSKNESNKAETEKVEAEKKEESAEDKEATAEEEKVEAKDPIPFDRFQEVVAEKNELKSTIEQVMPEVQAYRNIDTYCKKEGITPEQFTNLMQVQALLNNDPAKALERLLPIVDSLQGFVGNKLPQDLQAKVDSGKIELDDAKEIAQLRARSQFGQRKVQHDQQAWQAQQQATLQQQLVEASQSWETAKRTSDPDYKPDSRKWKMVRSEFLARLNEVDPKTGAYKNPVKTPQDMSVLMEAAYKEVNDTITAIRGVKPPTRKNLSSNGSSANSGKKTVEDAPTMAEAIAIGMAQRR